MKFKAFTNNIPLFYVFIKTIAIVNRSTYYIQRNRIADNIYRVFINYCVFLLNVAILHNSAKPDDAATFLRAGGAATLLRAGATAAAAYELIPR